jgi:phosphoglycolate phosphatase
MIKGILFDKDGTLIDFNAIWLPVIYELVDGLINKYDLSFEKAQELLASVGVFGQVVDSKGPFATGTGEQVGEALHKCLLGFGIQAEEREQFSEKVILDFTALAQKYRQRILPIGNLAQTMAELKRRGFYLGTSTSDTRENTVLCLEKLGILEYFDFLGTDDGTSRHKPHGDLLHAFCKEFALQACEVAIAGDTQVDLLFAKNNGAGLAVGVLYGTGTREDLAELADLLLPDVNSMLSQAYFAGRG